MSGLEDLKGNRPALYPRKTHCVVGKRSLESKGLHNRAHRALGASNKVIETKRHNDSLFVQVSSFGFILTLPM